MFTPPKVGESKDKHIFQDQVREGFSCQPEKLKLFPGTMGDYKESGNEMGI